MIDMPRLMSAIHVVLVLGTCATAGSAAVVQLGLSNLYRLFFKFEGKKLINVGLHFFEIVEYNR